AAVGEDVTSVAAGDEVLTHPLPLRHQGAWAEWLVAPAALVARKPPGIPWEAAAAFPVPALTADQALSEVAPAPAGEWVLVHGAGGATGGLAPMTGDPPPPERGTAVVDIYVRPDGARLAELAAALADGILSLPVAATFPLEQAATALQDTLTGRSKGANVLALRRGQTRPT